MAVRLNLAQISAAIVLLALALAAPASAQREGREERRLGEDSRQQRPRDDGPRTDSPPDDGPRGDSPRGEFRRPYRDDSLQSPPGEGGPIREFRGFGGGPPHFYSLTEATSSKGFVFLNGEYVPPPYEIRVADNVVTVNGKPLDCLPPVRSFGYRGFTSRPPEVSWRSSVSEISGDLSSDFAVLCFKDQPYVRLDGTLTYDLLKAMTAEGGRALRQVSIREQLPAGFDKAIWDAWMDNFDPPGDLLQRAAVLTNRFELTQQEAEADMRATRLLNSLSYPLAVGGMVLTVLAIGHLLGGRPHARQRLTGRDDSPEMLHSLNWSLLFIAAFSFLDLTWTILAANAGQMHELNPIGSHLVENPRHLAGFKIGITLPSLALIWLLRKNKRAQVAAWWLCLILTFVTLRWLTFSPLMAPV